MRVHRSYRPTHAFMGIIMHKYTSRRATPARMPNSNLYKIMCALWVRYRKSMFQQLVVAYNNAHIILNLLPMRCSASHMLATARVNSCKSVLRKSI